MPRFQRQGFTRIQLLIVLVIVGILIGLVYLGIQRVREAAARMRCHGNMKQLMLAFHNFHDADKPISTYFPRTFPTGCIGPGKTPEERLSWIVALTPFMEQDNAYRQIDFEQGYEGNRERIRTRFPQLICGRSKVSNPTEITNYIAMAGLGRDAAKQPAGTLGNGFMGYDRLTTIAMIQDGLSNTITLMDTQSNLGPWIRGGPSTLRGFDPADLPWCGKDRPFGGAHRGGTVIGIADGSTRFLRDTIDPKLLSAAITIADGEKENLD
jgi:Tfp pilus assembly protein PilE